MTRGCALARMISRTRLAARDLARASGARCAARALARTSCARWAP